MPRNPYVADGLVAWWDGLWNAGLGVHDAAATVWRDLVGGFDININKTGISTGSNMVRFRGYSYVERSLNGLSIRTEEIVCAGYSVSSNPTSGGGTEPAILSNGGWKLQYNINNRRAGWGVAGQYNPTLWSGPGADGAAFAAAFSSDGTTRREYFSGAQFLVRSRTGTLPSQLALSRDSSRRMTECDILCLRIYNRVLTDAEVAANYAVDKERFGLP